VAQLCLQFKATVGVTKYQRFADVNQRIFSAGTELPQPFPTGRVLHVNSSKRFGNSIAAVANSLRIVGEPIVGDSPHGSSRCVIFLFDENSVTNVASAFGEEVFRRVPAHLLQTGPVKAVCARQDPTPTPGAGRFLADYAPHHLTRAERNTVQPILIEAVRDAKRVRLASGNMPLAIRKVRHALLQIFKELGSQPAVDAFGWKQMLTTTSESCKAKCLRLVQWLVLGAVHWGNESEWNSSLDSLFMQLEEISGLSAGPASQSSQVAFLAPSLASGPSDLGAVTDNESDVSVEFSTIAKVKGETHAATLVLESCYKGKYDITEAMPYLCGEVAVGPKLTIPMSRRLHNLFVAATRPRHLLAFTIHRARLSDVHRAKLVALEWDVIEVT